MCIDGFFYARNHPWHTLAHEVCIPLDPIGTGVSRRRDIRHLGTGVSRRRDISHLGTGVSRRRDTNHLGTGVSRRRDTNSSRYGCIKETRHQSSRSGCIKESRHQSSRHEYIKEMKNQSSRHRCINEMRHQSSRHECTKRTKAQREQKDRWSERIDKCERSFPSSVFSSPISSLHSNIPLSLHLSITFSPPTIPSLLDYTYIHRLSYLTVRNRRLTNVSSLRMGCLSASLPIGDSGPALHRLR